MTTSPPCENAPVYRRARTIPRACEDRLAWLSAIATIAALAQAEAAPPFRPDAFDVALAIGAGSGVGNSSSIHELSERIVPRLRLGAPFSIALEVAIVRFVGARDGNAVDTLGITVLPLAAWHFLRLGRSSLAFEFGLGGSFFASAFPPGGTQWNGYSSFGLGTHIAVSRYYFLTGDVRFLHHSNGQGLIPENPAYDGVAINLGVELRAWP